MNDEWGWSIIGFVVGLSVGLGLWFRSSQQWNRALQAFLKQYPVDENTIPRRPQVKLLKAFQSQLLDERQLRQSLQRFQTILHQAPLGYLEVDEAGCLHWFNQRAAILLSIDRPSPPTAPPRLLLQVVRSYELDRLVLKTRKTQIPQQRDWTFHAPSPHHPSLAKDFPIRARAFPHPSGKIGVFLEDRSEAVQLLAERDRWTSDVAHELKTPLTSIRLIAETLQGRIDEDSKPWLNRLIQETVRLSVLVQDILELSHLSFRNSNAFKFSQVDLAQLIQQAWVTLEPLAQAKDLLLFYDGPDMYPIKGDGSRLLRVLMNVVDNSIKYSPVNAPISIRLIPQVPAPLSAADTLHTWMMIEIYDRGSGFPEESLRHVFKRFYKGDPSRGRSAPSALVTLNHPLSEMVIGGGSGLGLAIVHQIVTAHGGYVEAQNHPETGGAWIRIFLPNLIE
jgi:two-component system, OmpR family, phosphate regulon sensor histidine kinase PhoR